MNRKLRFPYFFKQWVRQTWDPLGMVCWISFLFFITLAAGWSPLAILASFVPGGGWPPILGLLAIGLCAGIGLAVTVSCWVAIHRTMDCLLESGEVEWRDFFIALTVGVRKSLWFLFSVGGLSAVLLFNLRVYPIMFAEWPILRTVAVSLTVWMLLFIGMTQVHLVAFLAHQDTPFAVALKRAMKVTIWRPFRTLFLLAAQGVTLVLFFPPLCFILPGMVAIANQLSLAILLEEWKDPYEKTEEAVKAGV